jgi:DNA-binding NarL/FixJ family response regulator
MVLGLLNDDAVLRIMKILIVDDHELLRGGLVLSLRNVAPEAIVLQASSLGEAKAAIGSTPDLDLVLIDLHLPDSKGLATLVDLRAWCEMKNVLPRIVVISGTEEPAIVRGVIQENATGFIPKSVSDKIFAHAVRITLDGGVYIPELLCRSLTHEDSFGNTSATAVDRVTGQSPKLTEREGQIAALLVRGLTYKQIARELAKRDDKEISELTVRTHVSNIAWKMGVQSGGKLGVMAEISRRGLKYP